MKIKRLRRITIVSYRLDQDQVLFLIKLQDQSNKIHLGFRDLSIAQQPAQSLKKQYEKCYIAKHDDKYSFSFI